MLLKIHFFKYTLIITHTTYIYLHRKNGYCMDNYRNGQLGSYRCNTGYKWQKWDIINVSGSTFKIKNVHMKKCLIPGGKESNCDDARALWILEQATNRKRRAANDNNDTETMKSESTISTDSNPLIATPENCNLPINCNFFLQPNEAYYKSG